MLRKQITYKKEIINNSSSNRIVPKIRHPTSLAEVSHPVEVATAFQTFYKNLYDAPEEAPSTKELVPKLCGVFNYALHENDPPKRWSEALITVIHKEGKDPLECGAYRPVSLLGSDVKILSSILANRMQKYLRNLINPD